MKELKYFYKNKNGKGYTASSIKFNDDDLIAITKEEWEEHRTSLHHEPTAEQKAKAETKRRIAELKRFLNNTDWVVIKIAEETDATKIAALREKYASVIADRISVRAEINEFEEQL